MTFSDIFVTFIFTYSLFVTVDSLLSSESYQQLTKLLLFLNRKSQKKAADKKTVLKLAAPGKLSKYIELIPVI